MVEHKERIEGEFFELALTDDGASAALELLVEHVRKVLFDDRCVLIMFVGLNERFGVHERGDRLQKVVEFFGVIVESLAIFFARKFCQMSKSSNGRDVGAEDEARACIDGKRDRKWFEFGVLDGDEIVKLQVRDGTLLELEEQLLLREARFFGEVLELALDGGAMKARDASSSPHRDAGSEQFVHELVASALFLSAF